MIYFFIKNWSIGIILFIICMSIAIKPELITKYGYTNKVINNIVRYISLLLIILWILPHKELSIDTLGYFKNKNSYIQEIICNVKETDSSVWFFFAQKSILCKNNDRFTDVFTSRFYSKGDILKIKYLPESKLIVDVENIKEKGKK